MLQRIAVPAEPSAAPDADDLLVRQAQADATAFATLYERYQPRIYNFLYARTHDADEAADLTQTVFLRALAALPSYQPRGLPFAAWLFRIARNTAADAQRRRQRRPSAALPPEVVDRRAGEISAAIERREALQRLDALLAGIDASQRELLALRFAGGLKAHEIAAIVGKSEAAVKKQLSRTIHKLQERFDEQR